MVSILNNYYIGPSNDIIAKDNSINPSQQNKLDDCVLERSDLKKKKTNKQKQQLKASVIYYIPKLSQGKQTY